MRHTRMLRGNHHSAMCSVSPPRHRWAQLRPHTSVVTLHYTMPRAAPDTVLVSAGRLLSLSVPALVSQSPMGILGVRAIMAPGMITLEYDARSTWPTSGSATGTAAETWNAQADLDWPHQWTNVAALARRVTVGTTGAAAEATALETYLRTHLPMTRRWGLHRAGKIHCSIFCLQVTVVIARILPRRW